jgi:choline dehydrogenase-like flavoprotein
MARSPRLAAKKDLHDGRALWVDSPKQSVVARRLTRDESCDVAIIGGGISGAITALMLSEAGHDVIVLDRRPPGSGSTIASTAMIQFEIDTPLTELGEKIGRQKAECASLRSAKAVHDLKSLVDVKRHPELPPRIAS